MLFFFFFFKQKTAYEMRISDWSSDVCSSDLLMIKTGSLEVLGILCGAAAEIAEGEVLQLVIANDTASSEDDYLKVIKAKTAALFAAACRVSAIIAGRPARKSTRLNSSH